MKKIFCFFILIFIYSLTSFAQKLKEVNVKFMLRGYFHAQSSIIDTTAFGGFGLSPNTAKQINQEQKFDEKKDLQLFIDTKKIIPFDSSYQGYKVFLVNKTDSIARFEASDSRLDIIAEVLIKGEWQPIEYLPSSWCGNSYHYVFLKQNEYWEFVCPKYSGKEKVKMRLRLILSPQKSIYSNEIRCSINKQQFYKKLKYQPQGLMDSYSD